MKMIITNRTHQPFSYTPGPPTVFGDSVLVSSADSVDVAGVPTRGSGGWVYALDKNTGNILSSFETKSGVFGGFSGNRDCMYIGSGYRLPYGYSTGRSVFGWCADTSSPYAEVERE